MRQHLQVMQESITEGLNNQTQGLILAGLAEKLRQAKQAHLLLGGPLFEKMITYATAVAELNATMGRIVACPTAGSCGILPGAVLALAQEKNLEDEAILEGLFVAAGIGIVSGNVCGLNGAWRLPGRMWHRVRHGRAALSPCWVETQRIVDAASMALQCLLGLVCDGRTVECPIYRNAAGVAVALSSANFTLAVFRGDPDEVVVTMAKIGRQMPRELKETSLGGLAITPTGEAIARPGAHYPKRLSLGWHHRKTFGHIPRYARYSSGSGWSFRKATKICITSKAWLLMLCSIISYP